MANPALTDVSGIGEAGAARLREAGIRSVSALVDASLDDLEAIPGVGRATAVKIKRSARSVLARSRPEPAAVEAQADDEDTSGPAERDDKKKKGKKSKKSKKSKKGKKKGKKGKGKKGKGKK